MMETRRRLKKKQKEFNKVPNKLTKERLEKETANKTEFINIFLMSQERVSCEEPTEKDKQIWEYCKKYDIEIPIADLQSSFFPLDRL